MDKNLQKVCGMLQSPDGMRRCAAAMVLAELAPKEPGVVKALGESLQNGASQLLTRYVLEAFDAISTRAVVPYVLPLLNAEDLETKLRAVGIVARAGGDVLPEIKKQMAGASPQQKLVLVDILARIHDRAAFQTILELLFDNDFELVKETCQAVRRHITDAAPKDRVALHKQVVSFMNSARVKKNDRVLTSCLLLAGYIGGPDARHLLLKYAAPKMLGYIRRNALIGLKGIELTGAAVNPVARQLVKCLDETDPVIAQHALDIIEKLPLPKGYDAQWRKLLKGQHAPVRAFAVRKLAVTDNPANNKLMLALLAHEDPQVSDIAASTLARHKGATKLLLDALAREHHAEAAWRLAKILKPHGGSVDKKTMKKFSTLAAKDIAEGRARYEALFYFLRNVDAKAADTVLCDTAMKFKKARRWGKAVDCLRQLINTESFDNEIRFELSVCNLKQSPKDLAPHLRAEDHALRGIQGLLPNKPFNVLDRLRKEPMLDAADLCYIGFHFAELPGADNAEFGRALLEQIVKRWPASKEAKAAKNKLKLAGGTAEPTA
jgi:HEAT repeat protein